jgi:HK97 family phage prohead protease
MQQEIERRSQKRSRDAAKTSGTTASGYALRWDIPTQIGSGDNSFIEVVRRGACDRNIRQKKDVRCLVNHDPSLIVGRTANGTLALQEDDKGLRFKCDVANTQTGADLLENLRTQTWSGCSFGFSVPAGGDRWTTTINGNTGKRCDLRELLNIDLWDVSIVTYPQYSGTSAVRDIDEEDEDEDDAQQLLTLAATAASSRSMPIELRSAINKAIECGGAMSIEERLIYTRALMLEIQADR